MLNERNGLPEEFPTNPFPLGTIYLAPEVLDHARAGEILAALRRHQTGDWGECTAEDWKSNDDALIEETTIYSAYRTKRGVVFTIVTSGDRSITTIAVTRSYYRLDSNGRYTRIALWAMRCRRFWEINVRARRVRQLLSAIADIDGVDLVRRDKKTEWN
jgi:hypothetical protein